MPLPLSPLPTLPLAVIEEILTLAPRIHTQLVTTRRHGFQLDTRFSSRLAPLTVDQKAALMRVLPHCHVPRAVQCVLAMGPNIVGEKQDLLIDLIKWLTLHEQDAPADESDSLLALYLDRLVLPIGLPLPLPVAARLTWATAAAGNISLLLLMKTRGVDLNRMAINALSAASQHRHLHVLEWWKEQGLTVMFDALIGADVGRGGSLSILQWFFEQEAEQEHDVDEWIGFLHDTVESACRFGSVGLLEWLFNDEAEERNFLWNNLLWVVASEKGQIVVLDWATDAGFALPGPTTANWAEGSLLSPMDAAAACGHTSVLDWWLLKSHMPMYSHQALDKASMNGHVGVLEWFGASGLELRFTPAAISGAAAGSHAKCIEWWSKCAAYKFMVNGNPAPGNVVRMRAIPRDPATLVAFGRLDWLKKLGSLTDATASHQLMRIAVTFGQLHILQEYQALFKPLLDNHAFEVCYSAAQAGNLGCLQWLFRTGSLMSGRDLFPVDASVRAAIRSGQIEVLAWLLGVEGLRQRIRSRLTDVYRSIHQSAKPIETLRVLDGCGILNALTEDEVNRFVRQALEMEQPAVFEWWKTYSEKRFS